MPISPELLAARSSLGGYIRQGFPADDPAVVKARRALALAKTEDRIRKAVAEAPPLDATTLARLRALIPAAPTGGGA